MSNLKPCPFCGGEAELCYGPGLGTDSCRGYTLLASCNECGAKSPGLWQEKKPEPNDQSWKDAADEWNGRPSEPDLENCGVAYCEHYPEGLPVCSRCREESTLAHDKACALLAEARAEIERLKAFIDQRDRKLLKCIGQKCDKDKLIEQMKNCYNCKFELHAAKECETCNTADCDDSYLYETSNWQPKEPEAAERGE